jgi:NTP pyrophosphatase (non-canonical NTP hydrolase)
MLLVTIFFINISLLLLQILQLLLECAALQLGPLLLHLTPAWFKKFGPHILLPALLQEILELLQMLLIVPSDLLLQPSAFREIQQVNHLVDVILSVVVRHYLNLLEIVHIKLTLLLRRLQTRLLLLLPLFLLFILHNTIHLVLRKL